jgi:hypothetical protein
MNTKTILGIGVGTIILYYLLRNKKKVEVSDLQKEPANVIPAVVKDLKNQLLVSDLSSNTQGPSGIGGQVKVRRSRLILDQIKVPRKEPIVINPINSIPSIYDRGVGAEINLAASGELQGFEPYMKQTCTEQIQNACNCARENNQKYRLDIPQLP